jgi:hypothetical protein
MLRFSIRDVLWLTVVVALGVGWGLERVRLRQQQETFRKINLALQIDHAVLQAENAGLRAMEAGTSP